MVDIPKIGVNIKRGEKAIKIYVPNEIKYFIVNDTNKLYKNATKVEKGKIKGGTIQLKSKRVFYLSGNVFDVRQTNANIAKLDKSINKAFTKDQNEIFDKLLKYCDDNDVAYGNSNILAGANGELVGISDFRMIKVGTDLQMDKKINTMLHEISHHHLNHIERSRDRTIGVNQAEVEAELTAFLVASELGLEQKDHSLDYVKYYMHALSDRELTDTIEHISKSKNVLINKLGIEKQSINTKDLNISKNIEYEIEMGNEK